MTVVAPGAVAWFEIGTTDPGATEAFYGSLFGWRFELDPDATGGGTDDGTGTGSGLRHGRIVASGAAEPMGTLDLLPYGHTDGSALRILVGDVDAAVGTIESLGGTLVAPPADSGGAVVAHVRDPLGNVVALVSEATPAAPGEAAGGEPGRFARFEIGSTDMDATRRFYEQAFGWTFTSTGEGYYDDVRCPDGREVAGGLWDQSAGGDDFATFSILAEAMSPTAGRARKLGARQLAPASRNPDGVITTRLLDPSGAQFGLVVLPSTRDADDADGGDRGPKSNEG
jgi:uncharacterized protein